MCSSKLDAEIFLSIFKRIDDKERHWRSSINENLVRLNKDQKIYFSESEEKYAKRKIINTEFLGRERIFLKN